MEPKGKGVFLWQIKRVRDGDPGVIAGLARNARMSHVIIKVADGKYSYNITGGVDKVPGTVAALRARGIQPWGWQYIYGSDPVAEAKKAIERVKQFNLAGFVVNAEGQFKAQGMHKIAKQYMNELRKGLPSLPIGLSSYRYPSAHPDFPFKAFLDLCNFNMPQVYWIDLANPGQQLVKCVSEFRSLMPGQPIVPTGAAFSLGSWSVTPRQLVEFLNKARQLKLPGANFWEMATALEKGAWWRTIRDYSWAASPPEEEEVKLPVITLADPNLNIRSGPGTQYSVVGSYPFKSSVIIVNIVRESGDLWGKTDLGWIALRYQGSALTDLCK